MIGEKSMFQSLSPMSGGMVTFRGNQKGLIIGVGKVCIPYYPSINNVLLVKGLKHNLLSISQLCDSGYNVTFNFNKDMCIIQNKDNSLLLSTKRQGNHYKIKLGDLSNQKVSCLLLVKEHYWVWNKKFDHASWRLISKLQKHSLVRGLPKQSYQDDSICKACQEEKQVKSSSKAKKVVYTLRPLELLHLDLFGPTMTASISRCRYSLVIVDDCTRWIWVRFLTHRDESFDTFYKFSRKIQNEKGICISSIKNDHGGV